MPMDIFEGDRLLAKRCWLAGMAVLAVMLGVACPGGGKPGALPTPQGAVPGRQTPQPSFAVPTLALEIVEAGKDRNLKIKVNDGRAANGGASTVDVKVNSVAEPTGETVKIRVLAPGQAEFEGSMPIERLFDEAGKPIDTANNGKIAVYAEGATLQDTILATYLAAQASATYEEPPSTLTGVVNVGGKPKGGALVSLFGLPDQPRRETGSRSDGSYAFYDLPGGSYVVTVNVRGAADLTKKVTAPRAQAGSLNP